MAVDYYLRPMQPRDVPDVERLTAEAFHDLEMRMPSPRYPEPERRSPARAQAWSDRAHHLLTHDPSGCWVAESDAALVGVAMSLRRDVAWFLATFAVRPGLQGRGVGRQLLDAALSYGQGCLRGMIAASEDPLAVRRYRLAGFTVHPTMALRGSVAREVLPVVDRVREGSAGDIDLMNSVDRQVRDSAHGVDHEILVRHYPLVVIDRSTGSGYAYVDSEGGPYLLAATNRRTATDLLWETLAATSPTEPGVVDHLTAAQEWAVDVGIAARMHVYTSGFLALRHMKPPAPYIPSGFFL